MKSGWVPFWRRMLDNPFIAGNPNRIAVWWYLLLNATHDEQQKWFNNREILLQKGQLLTGRLSIERATGVNEKTVQRVLSELQKCGMIEQQTTNKNRLITVKNWEKWQVGEQRASNKMSNERATSEQRASTNNNDNNDKNVNNTIVATTLGVASAIDFQLANQLKEKIKENIPTLKEPNVGLWAKEIERMRRLDKRTPEQIEYVVNWCQKNTFWQSNILSAKKLREKFDILVAQIKRDSKNNLTVIG